jgi:hypothetical protein
LSNWQKAGWLTGFMKSGFPVETVDLSALAHVPAVHALQFPDFGLAFKKTQLYDRLRRSRCPYNRLKRPVSGEFRMVRPKQHFRSLANRSGGKVVPPQLPSGRRFIFQSGRLPATSTCRVSHSKILLCLAHVLLAGYPAMCLSTAALHFGCDANYNGRYTKGTIV